MTSTKERHESERELDMDMIGHKKIGEWMKLTSGPIHHVGGSFIRTKEENLRLVVQVDQYLPNSRDRPRE
jgi:hypothetical protein